MLGKDSMRVGPVTAEGSNAINYMSYINNALLANETPRGARLHASIEHTAYSGYFFVYVPRVLCASCKGAPEPRGRAALVNDVVRCICAGS